MTIAVIQRHCLTHESIYYADLILTVLTKMSNLLNLSATCIRVVLFALVVSNDCDNYSFAVQVHHLVQLSSSN